MLLEPGKLGAGVWTSVAVSEMPGSHPEGGGSPRSHLGFRYLTENGGKSLKGFKQKGVTRFHLIRCLARV